MIVRILFTSLKKVQSVILNAKVNDSNRSVPILQVFIALGQHKLKVVTKNNKHEISENSHLNMQT